MRKTLWMSLLLCATSAVAGAQTKIAGTLSCPRASVSEMGGDGGQMILFSKTNCTWSTPLVLAGSTSTSATDVEIGDMKGSSVRGHGFSTSVMDNGDTTITRYEGTVAMKKDGSSTFKGTWKFVRGTGKLAGISGGGTYSGTGTEDGGTVGVNGRYKISGGKGKKAM